MAELAIFAVTPPKKRQPEKSLGLGLKGGRPKKSEEAAKGEYRSLTGREKLHAIRMIGEASSRIQATAKPTRSSKRKSTSGVQETQ